jgi:hypothetical protein
MVVKGMLRRAGDRCRGMGAPTAARQSWFAPPLRIGLCHEFWTQELDSKAVALQGGLEDHPVRVCCVHDRWLVLWRRGHGDGHKLAVIEVEPLKSGVGREFLIASTVGDGMDFDLSYPISIIEIVDKPLEESVADTWFPVTRKMHFVLSQQFAALVDHYHPCCLEIGQSVNAGKDASRTRVWSCPVSRHGDIRIND